MKSCNHENMRRKFKAFNNKKANLSGGIIKIAAEQLVYGLYVKIGQTQQISVEDFPLIYLYFLTEKLSCTVMI